MIITLLDTDTIKHPTIANEFGVRLIFKCGECNKTFNVDSYDKNECNDIFMSISNGIIHPKIMCNHNIN